MPDIDIYQVILDGQIAFRCFLFKNTDPITMQQ